MYNAGPLAKIKACLRTSEARELFCKRHYTYPLNMCPKVPPTSPPPKERLIERLETCGILFRDSALLVTVVFVSGLPSRSARVCVPIGMSEKYLLL